MLKRLNFLPILEVDLEMSNNCITFNKLNKNAMKLEINKSYKWADLPESTRDELKRDWVGYEPLEKRSWTLMCPHSYIKVPHAPQDCPKPQWAASMLRKINW